MARAGPSAVFERGRLRYLLSLPDPGFAEEEAPPVLCFLHGYDEGAPMEIHAALTSHGPLRPGSSRIGRDRFVVVAPQLPLRGDLWHRYAQDVLEVVESVRASHAGDPARTYLTGFSFGGNGVFDLALRQPVYWAALWAVDPTRVPAADPGRPVWLSIGGVARPGKAAFVRALGLRPFEGASADRVYLDEGADHVGSATLAYADDRIYDWLLARRVEETQAPRA